MKTPACSVIMPLYNKEQEVLTTIPSVLNQTFTDFELLVINDGSTDLSVQVVEKFDDPRISIVSQENAGVSAARNTGVRLAQSELIVFIDADDLWHPDFLATIIALRNDYPQARWFATGYEIVHPEKGRSLSTLKGPAKKFRRGILSNYFGVGACSDPPVWSSATAVMRDAIQAIGGFPVGIGSGEDLLTWARLAVRFPLAYEARSLAVFRVSGIHRRADPANKVGHALEQLVENFPHVPSVRAYLGLWYRMQAVIAMRFGDAALARQWAGLAVRFGPCQIRNFYVLCLAALPGKARALVDHSIRKLAGVWRKKQKTLV
jgi:glycosyltransferase involved in cell wall biosynthesis